MSQWRRDQDQRDKGWQYWPGAWSASPKNAPWKKDWQKDNHAFPPYDAKTYGSDKPGANNAANEGMEIGIVQELQRAINQARKAESKVKRLHYEREERQAQWRKWEQDLKRTYSKEKNRFISAMNKNEGEMQEAIRQQEQARNNLRHVASGDEDAQDANKDAAFENDFVKLMEGPEDDPWDLDLSQDAVLQRALAQSLEDMPAATRTPVRGTGVPPRTPQHTHSTAKLGTMQIKAMGSASGSSRMTPFPPPMQTPVNLQQPPDVGGALTSAGAALLADPYQVVGQTAEEIAAGKTGVQGMLTSPVNGPPKTPKTRLGIKEGAKPHGPLHHGVAAAGRDQLLATKRANLTEQLGAPMQYFIHDDDDGKETATTTPLTQENNVMD